MKRALQVAAFLGALMVIAELADRIEELGDRIRDLEPVEQVDAS